MDLSFGRYRDLITRPDDNGRIPHDNDYIVRRPNKGLEIVTPEQWKREKWQQKQPGQWKEAKQEFLDFLDREWGAGAYKASPHHPQDGTPLEVREVRWMIDYNAARDRIAAELKPSPWLARDFRNVFVDPQEEIEKIDPKSPQIWFANTLDDIEMDFIEPDRRANEGLITPALPEETDSLQQVVTVRQVVEPELDDPSIVSPERREPLSAAQFRNIAKQDGYLLLSANRKTVAVFSQAVWAEYDEGWQRCESTKVKKEFVNCLAREYGPDIAELLGAYLPGDGKPLTSRDVMEIIEVGEAYRLAGVGEDEKAENGLANDPEIDALIADLDRSFDFESPGRRPREFHREIPVPPPPPPFVQGPATPFPYHGIQGGKSRVPPPADAQQPPAPPPVVAPQPQPAPARRGLQPDKTRGPRPNGPAAGNWSKPQAAKTRSNPEAELIQDTAWNEFNPLLAAIVKHVARAEDEAANRQLGKKKGKAEAAETEGQFKLVGGEKEFADLFVKPPKLAYLDQLLAKHLAKHEVTTNPLSVYFDLPRIMWDMPERGEGGHYRTEPGKHWLFRMANAETKLDAQQVIREIDDTIEQLGRIILEIENSMPDSGKDRALLVDATKRLRSMESFLNEKSSPLMDLKARCDELVRVLPDEDELPPIPQDKWLALDALVQMGIGDDPTQDATTLAALANRMRKADNLLRRGIMEGEGKTWQDIHDVASDSDKVLLKEYRDLRLRGIEQKVRETGVVMKLVDGKDGNKLYHFTIDGNEDERQARYWQTNYLLSTIAFSMGGAYRDLTSVFGYEETTLEKRVADQRAREQAE